MPYDPLAPLPPRAQRRQAHRYVWSQIMPLLQQLNKEFARRSASGQAAIGGYTNALAAHLAPLRQQTHDIYQGAEQQQSAVDTALANRLQAAGQGLGSEVQQKLVQAGIGGGNALAQTGAGAAAASQGIGSAGLAALIARGAAAENYSGQLPGIARLGGYARSKQYGAQLESERATQAGALRGKVPGLIQQVLADIQNREFQKAAARLSYGGTLAGIQGENQRAQLSYDARMAAIAAANARTGMTLRERAHHNGVTEAEQARRDREAARHNRQTEKTSRYRAHHPGKGKKKKKGPFG